MADPPSAAVDVDSLPQAKDGEDGGIVETSDALKAKLRLCQEDANAASAPPEPNGIHNGNGEKDQEEVSPCPVVPPSDVRTSCEAGGGGGGGSSEGDEVCYVVYESEVQMPDIMRLIQKDLSEPYSIYTYRYFIHNWPHLCFMVRRIL